MIHRTQRLIVILWTHSNLYLNHKQEIKINICDFDASFYGHNEYEDGGCYQRLSHLIIHSVDNEGEYKEK